MNILVGIDLSEETQAIIKEARQLATMLKAKVWLLHVAEPEPDFVGYDAGPQTERDAISQQFHREHSETQAIADDLRQEGLDVTALLVRGPTAETIINESKKLEADMIIVGSHGRGAMHRLLVGSISEGVLRHAEKPVLVIPTHNRN